MQLLATPVYGRDAPAWQDTRGASISAHHFICYSKADGQDFARALWSELRSASPPFPVWMDEFDIHPGHDWDRQIEDAIENSTSILFVMTPDSVSHKSECKWEWTLAREYRKPIIPIRLHPSARMPRRWATLHWIDATGAREVALRRICDHLRWMSSPAGVLAGMKTRLDDADRALLRESDHAQRFRIEREVTELEDQIREQELLVDGPKGGNQRSADSQLTKSLNQSLQRLSAAVDTTDEAVMVTDRLGELLYVNPAFERMTGYRRDEALGSTPRLLKSGLHPPEVYARLWATILRGDVFRGVLMNRRKDGTVFESE